MDNELTASLSVFGNSSSAKRKRPDRLDWLKYFPVVVRVSSLGLSSFFDASWNPQSPNDGISMFCNLLFNYLKWLLPQIAKYKESAD